MTSIKILLPLLVLLLGAVPAFAQATADVRTWSGASWRITDPILHVFYTVFEKDKEETGGVPTASALPPPPVGAPLEIRGSLKALSTFLKEPPQSLSAERASDVVTVWRDGVETRLPLDAIQSLQFFRQALVGSSLPPYVAPLHVRESVVVIMANGSRVEADYVNLGTAVLRGTAGQGKVDIPWGEIESVRFSR
jgi:hypothetical protein